MKNSVAGILLSANCPDVSRACGGEGKAAWGCQDTTAACFITLLSLGVWLSVFIFPGDRVIVLNDTKHQADFKSRQWFGATVRSHGDTILVRWPWEEVDLSMLHTIVMTWARSEARLWLWSENSLSD